MKKKIFTLILIWLVPFFTLFLYYSLYLMFDFSIPCFLHKLTNLYCPTCGITRLLIALLNGNIYEAFKYNQLMFILLPLVIIYFGILSYLWIKNKINRNFIIISKYLLFFVIVLLVVFGIIRNLDNFSYLRP